MMNNTLSPRSLARLHLYEQQGSMLLSLDKLRQRCIAYLKSQTQSLSDNPFDDNRHLDSPAYRFAWQLVSTYRSTLPDIVRDVNGCTPQILYREMFCKRRRDIVSFICSQLSRRWDIVDDDDETWMIFANNIPFDDPQRSKEVSDFFRLLDSIAITNDILELRGETYDINMEVVVPDQLEMEDICEGNFSQTSPQERDIAPVSTLVRKAQPTAVPASDDEHRPAATASDDERYAAALSICVETKIAQQVFNLLESMIAGKRKAIDVVRPVRAAIQAGVINRMTWKEFCQLFGEDRVSRSSYNEYTNPNNRSYQGDQMYESMYFMFTDLKKRRK